MELPNSSSNKNTYNQIYEKIKAGKIDKDIEDNVKVLHLLGSLNDKQAEKLLNKIADMTEEWEEPKLTQKEEKTLDSVKNIMKNMSEEEKKEYYQEIVEKTTNRNWSVEFQNKLGELFSDIVPEPKQASMRKKATQFEDRQYSDFTGGIWNLKREENRIEKDAQKLGDIIENGGSQFKEGQHVNIETPHGRTKSKIKEALGGGKYTVSGLLGIYTDNNITAITKEKDLNLWQ